MNDHQNHQHVCFSSYQLSCWKLSLSFLVLVCALSSYSAESEDKLKTFTHEMTAPTVSPAIYILGAGAVLTTTLLLIKNEHGDDTLRQAHKVRPLGEFSSVGNVLGYWVPNGLYAGWMWYDWHKNKNQDSKARSLLMAKASVYSALTTHILKYSVRQLRPDNSERASFPSGHASSAFAFASIIGVEHGWQAGVPAYLLAGLIGYSRLNDNRHYTHDVVAGATLGTAYGVGLWAQSGRNENKHGTTLILPTLDSPGLELNFVSGF